GRASRGKQGELVVSASDLERAGGLERLELQPYLGGAGRRGERGSRLQRRLDGDAAQTLASGQDVSRGWQGRRHRRSVRGTVGESVSGDRGSLVRGIRIVFATGRIHEGAQSPADAHQLAEPIFQSCAFHRG